MSPTLDGLNESQRQAVLWDNGPLLVLAGPGSGKTKVLTMRAARLIEGNPSASVLALTFTTRAAEEMRERLDNLLGGRVNRAHLCTFHSYAGDILRQHGSHVGIQPDYSLLTLEDDRLWTLERAIERMSEEYQSMVPSGRRNLLTFVDRLFSGSYEGGNTAPGLVNTPNWVPSLFQAYCEVLKEYNRLDYGALLYFARHLLESHSGVARVLRFAWTYICVDEFQDTNRAQYDLLRSVVGGGKPNLFVVADDDQIIYQWNGASPERLQALRHEYEMEVIQLPQNYRCPNNVIQIANRLIQHNQTRTLGKEPLMTERRAEMSDVVFLDRFQNDHMEAEAIARTIRVTGLPSDDCVVLARSARILQSIAAALSEAGLAPYLAQRKNEFESDPIRWIYSTLRLANARHDAELLRRTCVSWQAMSGIPTDIAGVDATAALAGGDYLVAWLNVARAQSYDDTLFETLLTQVQSKLVDHGDFSSLVEWFWKQEWADDLAKEEIATWKDLHDSLLREQGKDNITLYLYLQEMDLKAKTPLCPKGSIPCLTVHGAKGQEFKHVFLAGMAEEVFPSYQAVRKGDASSEMEEERRSCFVAITRVQETLHISYSRNYSGYPKRPSRFLTEMGFTAD